MSQKLLVALTVVSMSLVMLFTGCTPEPKETTTIEPVVEPVVQPVVESVVEPVVVEPVNLASAVIALKLNSGDSATYKYTFETIQDYQFEQPKLKKNKIEQNLTKVETTFLQEIQSVNADSSAVVKITLKGLVIFMKDRNGVNLDFDSSRDADQKKPINALIGKSYTIQITSDGKVSVVDAKAVRAVIIRGFAGRIAKNFLSNEEIAKRHGIISLPDKTASTVQETKGWSRIVASHPKLLERKSFEKTYTLDGVDNDIATVSMSAFESDKPAEGVAGQTGGFGIMAKMFDTQEEYEGKMKFNVATGQVVDLNEKFVATYVAAETTVKSGDVGPDTLTMGLTHIIKLVKIDK